MWFLEKTLLYFLKDGKIHKLTEQDLLLKNWRELEHVHYLFQVKDDDYIRWAKRIETTISERQRLLQEKISGYTPKYIDDTGKEVKMKKDGVVLHTSFGMNFLSFSTDAEEVKCIYLGDRIKASSIEDLRAAIYQTTNSTGEVKKIHDEMIQVILCKEKELMDEFLNRNWAYKTVADWQK